MSNRVFMALLREKANQFRAAFSTVSTEVFYDDETEQLRHTGEYGTFREAVVRDFLEFVIPRSLDISTGFIITPMDDVSTQCDVVIFDSGMTPLYEESDRQRFFPIESTSCVIEVKSTLSKTGLRDALNKLSEIKRLSGRMEHPTLLDKSGRREFDAVNYAYDRIPTVLICNNLDFNRSRGLENIENEIDDLYNEDVHHRHKHNMILSVEDGLLSYYDNNGKTLPYPRLGGNRLKNRFTRVNSERYDHFKLFSTIFIWLQIIELLFIRKFLTIWAQ